MSSFKKLNKADVTTVPYAANKQWNLTYDSGSNDSYAVYSVGTNEPFNITGSKTTNNQYQSLIYAEINHLFYQAYTSNLDTGSIMFNLNTYQSASQYRPTSSYFNYNINPLLVKQFPTGSGEQIGVLSINQSIYGSKILPHTFYVSSSNTFIVDDGNGNLYDIQGYQSTYLVNGGINSSYFLDPTLNIDPILVGNIFYAHGLIVITNQTPVYQALFNLPSCTTYDLTADFSFTTIFSYIDCTTGLSTSLSVRRGQTIRKCINTNYPITSNQANASYTPIANCSPTSIRKTISFKNEHIIYENEVRCIIKESEYNLSYNPSLLQYGGQHIVASGSGFILTGSFDSTVKGFATGSDFNPYTTTIGLYNDDNDLLMVAKLVKPILISPDTDMTFIVKYDT
jgi:hypothetical protein